MVAVNPKARCCTVQSRGFCAQSPQWYLLTSCCFGWYTPHISFEDSVCQRDDLWEVGTWKAIRGFRCSGLRGRLLWVSSWYNQALSREVALCNLFSPLHTSRYQSFHLSYQCHPCICCSCQSIWAFWRHGVGVNTFLCFLVWYSLVRVWQGFVKLILATRDLCSSSLTTQAF